jgi:hypothetical protein
MTFGSTVLVVLVSGWVAYSITGYSIFRKYKTQIHEILGRKIKWSDYRSAGLLFAPILWLIVTGIELTTGWWVLGLLTLESNKVPYKLDLVGMIANFNSFSEEDFQKLEKWATTREDNVKN